MIELHELQICRGTAKPITASIPTGSITVISGPNGIGKSTMLLTLLGELPPINGTLSLDGRDLTLLTLPERASAFAYAAQQPEFHLPLTVRRILELVGADLAHPMLVRFGLTSLLNASVHALSGGERQRVSLAIALMCETPCVILDEPLASQDAHFCEVITDELTVVANNHRAVIVTSHLPIQGARELALG